MGGMPPPIGGMPPPIGGMPPPMPPSPAADGPGGGIGRTPTPATPEGMPVVALPMAMPPIGGMPPPPPMGGMPPPIGGMPVVGGGTPAMPPPIGGMPPPIGGMPPPPMGGMPPPIGGMPPPIGGMAPPVVGGMPKPPKPPKPPMAGDAPANAAGGAGDDDGAADLSCPMGTGGALAGAGAAAVLAKLRLSRLTTFESLIMDHLSGSGGGLGAGSGAASNMPPPLIVGIGALCVRSTPFSRSRSFLPPVRRGVARARARVPRVGFAVR